MQWRLMTNFLGCRGDYMYNKKDVEIHFVILVIIGPNELIWILNVEIIFDNNNINLM